MQKREQDYDRIVKGLLEKNISVGHLSDTKNIECMELMNKMEQYVDTTAQLDFERNIRNAELNRTVEHLLNYKGKITEDEHYYKNKCAHMEANIKRLETDRDDFLIDTTAKSKELINDYHTVENICNPEYISAQIALMREENGTMEEDLRNCAAVYEHFQNIYDGIDLEMPEYAGVFVGKTGGDLKKTRCDLAAAKKKLRDIERKLEELCEKINNLN